MNAARGTGTYRPARTWLLFLLGVVGLLWWRDHASLERGNRLYRNGETESAAELYRARSQARGARAIVSYNLGTALLTLGPNEAEGNLRSSTDAADSATVQRAHYNLGYLFLTRVDAATEPDSAIRLVAAAVANNRVALRLDPDDASARWNLALGQYMLDSLTHLRRDDGIQDRAGEDETRIDETARTRSGSGDGASGLEPENPRAADNIGARRGATEGASEAWASHDPGPMTMESARLLVDGVSDDPEQLVRGLLWSLRPDIAWWYSQPYPGGNW